MTYEVGDEVTITIKGKIVRPDPNAFSTDVQVSRKRPLPARSYVSGYAGIPSYRPLMTPDLSLTLPLDPDAQVTIEHRSQWKNGVHIDLADGSYWMRRPDGWHPMVVFEDPQRAYAFAGGRAKPENPQRLKEAR